MRQPFLALIVVATVLLGSSRYACAQNDCTLPDVSTLRSLIANTFVSADSPTVPTIQIIGNVTYVCQMSGMFRDMYRGISLLARYECTGSPLCPSDVVEKSQFDFSCGSGGMWISQVLGSTEFIFTENPVANLTTPLRTDCSFCVSPSLLEAMRSPLVSDEINHCVACSAACNEGARRCFGITSGDCCNFFNPADGKCLTECQADRIVTNDFTCTAFARFSMSEYVFAEEQGTGSVTVEGSSGVTVRVFGGPNRDMADVRLSGTDVNQMVTSLPATVTFNITDDAVSVEVNETYPLTLMVADTTVLIEELMTTIVITDDVDRMLMGFASRNFQRIEGNTTSVDARVFGEAVRDYQIIYIQERELPLSALSQELTVMGAVYAVGDKFFPPIVNPDDEIALQDDRIYEIGLQAVSEFANDVEFGAVIGSRQTFQASNLTIIDDDVVTVRFDPISYTVLESENVMVTLSLDRGIDTSFSVIIQPVLSAMPIGLVSSIPTTTYMVVFPESSVPQSQTFLFTPVDDNVPNEPNEQIRLDFSMISDSRVIEGATANVVIIDDDELGAIGFAVPSYTFSEDDGVGIVTVEGPTNFPSTLSVNIVGGPGVQENVIISGTDVNQSLTSFPMSVSFIINDDETAIEAVERYSLRLIPSDPSITINQATAEIFILDDDRIIVGFPYDAKTFQASDVGNATMKVFGTALQDFVINYVQEFGGTTVLQFPADVYPIGFERELPLIFTRNPDGPQNYFFQIALRAVSPPNAVDVGGVIGMESPTPVFAVANITIVDDAILVGFQDQEYTFAEGGDGTATVLIRRGAVSDVPFTVEVSAETMTVPFVFPSAIASLLQGTVRFGAGTVSPIVPYLLDIQNDEVALEDAEVFTLRLGSPSSSRVRIGGTAFGLEFYAVARVTIVDDDLAQIGFTSSPFLFSENRPATNIGVVLSNDIVDGRSVTVSVVEEGRGDMQYVVQSFFLPAVRLIFTDQGTMLIQPNYMDDVVGLEDAETLDLVLQAVTDPSQIQFGLSRASINIFDNEAVTIRIDGASTRTISEGDSIDVCVSKDIQSVRMVNFSLTPMEGTAGGQDYSPNSVQPGSLSLDALDQECFPFSAVDDGVVEADEVFTISLRSTDSIPSGTGAIDVENDLVTVTIVAPTPTPTPGVDVEDTVIGDPLFTVPIPDSQHLCYEIRGTADRYFNFISDSCVSVNAHYVEHSVAGDRRPLHVVDQIGIRAVDNASSCVNILVDRNGCTTSVNSSPRLSYSRNGITVVATSAGAVVNVPNCNDVDLEMEIICENMIGVDMLRFEVTRGTNLREVSHGLLAQFWNVQISTETFSGRVRGSTLSDDIVLVTLTPSGSRERRFPAWKEQKTWDNRLTCLYAGNQNGGTVFEVADAHDSLIEGGFKDYVVGGAFSTQFRYAQFESSQCT